MSAAPPWGLMTPHLGLPDGLTARSGLCEFSWEQRRGRGQWEEGGGSNCLVSSETNSWAERGPHWGWEEAGLSRMESEGHIQGSEARNPGDASRARNPRCVGPSVGLWQSWYTRVRS